MSLHYDELEGVNMSEPNPPTGEWTKETVREICRGAHGIEQEWQRCANAHNAALAAEEQKRADWNVVIEDLERALATERAKPFAQALDDSRILILQLREQLAAERGSYADRARRAMDDCERCDVRKQLREQLAAEREKRERAEEKRTIHEMSEWTAGTVSRLIDEVSLRGVADAHNAALAAERERFMQAYRDATDAALAKLGGK